MLRRLSIRNVVLIESLDIDFSAGLNVLTGETGSGKSILLDSLGLVLGMRGEARLVRSGEQSATVAAEFDISGNAPCKKLLEELGLPVEDNFFLRRAISADGKSRAWAMDVPVSISTLAQIGNLLVEIHGQHDVRGLLDPRNHRDILDAYGRLQPRVKEVSAAWSEWRNALKNAADHAEALAAAKRDEEYLRHVLAELDKLNPEIGEEEQLAESRRRMMAAEKHAGNIKSALDGISETEVTAVIRNAEKELLRLGDNKEAEQAMQLLGAASDNIEKAQDVLATMLRESAYDESELERIEERLFAIRAAARKHQCQPDELALKRQQVAATIASLEKQQQEDSRLQDAVNKAAATYKTVAEKLSDGRKKSQSSLAKAVMKEFPALKLAEARFEISLLPHDGDGSEYGLEQAQFMAAMNKGGSAGALHKVASGGELSRVMLACKVALAGVEGVPCMVFDEIDTGIGGAVADAVGKRLAVLAAERQVFVVTHQPQVASYANSHFVVSKESKNKKTITSVNRLDNSARSEELARMLAGAEITDEARKAAKALLEKM